MKVNIRWKGTEPSTFVEEHALQKTLFKLGRFGNAVKRVLIKFEDINGPKGGIDKSCMVKVDGTFGSKIIEYRDSNFYTLSDRILETTEYIVRRAIERGQGHRPSR